MRKSTIIMDSDSEEDEYSPNSERINEIIAKARDVQRIQKPLLRELINPNIEDDIRKNYRRSIVRRAMQSNIVTSTPCPSSALHPYSNFSCSIELENAGENNTLKNTVQDSKLSRSTRAEMKNISAEGINNPNKESEVLDMSGVKLLDNFKKPLPRNFSLASTSELNRKEKRKAHEPRNTLRNTSMNKNSEHFDSNHCSGKAEQMTDLKSVETSLLRRNVEDSIDSRVGLEYKCSSQSTVKTNNKDIIPTQTEDNNKFNNENIEYIKENVPYSLSNTRHRCLCSRENSGVDIDEVTSGKCNKSKVENDFTQCTSRQKARYHCESCKKTTRKSKKYTQLSKLRVPDSNGCDHNLVRHKNDKSHKLSVKEKNIEKRGRSSKYHDQGDTSVSSFTNEIFVEKKESEDDYIQHNYREKKKPPPETNKKNTGKFPRKKEKPISDSSIDRYLQKKKSRHYNLNDSTESMSSTLYSTKSKKSRKVPVKVYKKRNIGGIPSKYQYQSDISISSATEKYGKRSQKKKNQKKAELKLDKRKSKHIANIDTSDAEWKRDERNRKMNVFKNTKSFLRRKHKSPVSISSHSTSVEYDQSCVLQDSSEGSSSEYNNIYLCPKKSQRKSYRYLKYPKEYRGKSIARKINSRSAKYSYYYPRNNISDLEGENNDVNIMKTCSKYSRLSKMRNNELKMRHYKLIAKEYKKPNKGVENDVSSDAVNLSNRDITSFSSLPKKSLQVMVNSLVKKALQKFESEKILKKTFSKDAPIKTQKRKLVKSTKELPQSTQSLSENERDPEFNFICNSLFQNIGTYSDDFVSFGHSRTPSILSNKEPSSPQKISVKYIARKPFINLDNNTITSAIELSDPNFYFFKKRRSVENKIIQKKNTCDALFQRFREVRSENQNVNCVPLTNPSGNWNYRKSLLPSERIAIKAKLDEVLGINENDCNEEKIIIQEEPEILDAVSQFSNHSQISLKNSKIHNSKNEKDSLFKINSPNKLSQRKKNNLSVATQYSPYINDAIEEKCLLVTSCNASNDTHNTLQNNIEVERDAGHSGNIKSLDEKNNMSPNTELNTYQVVNNDFIRSRTVLKFEEEMENNGNRDFISPIVEIEENCVSKAEIPRSSPKYKSSGAKLTCDDKNITRKSCPQKGYESDTLRNDFLIHSDVIKNNGNQKSSDQTLKQGENISSSPNSGSTQLLENISSTPNSGPTQLLVHSEENIVKENLSPNELASVTEFVENGEKPEAQLTNHGNCTSNDQTKIKLIHNITLQQGEDISTTPNSSSTQPLVYLEGMNIVEKREALSESLTESKRRRGDTEFVENDEKSEAQWTNNENRTSNDLTKMKVIQNITLQQGEDILSTSNTGPSKPIVYLERMNIVEMRKTLSKSLTESNRRQGDTELEENVEKSEAGYTNNGHHTLNDQTKMRMIKIETLQQKENISNTPTQPLVYLEKMNIEEKRETSSKSSAMPKKRRGRQKKANIGLTTDAKLEEICENPEGVRKSTRNKRPPQLIWWKSTIVEKEVGLMQYYQTSKNISKSRKGTYHSENERSSEVRTKSTSSKTGKQKKNNKGRDISIEKTLGPKKKSTKVSATSDSCDEKPSTSKATIKEITSVGDYSIKNILPGERKEDTFLSPITSTSENYDDPGYVTSSTRNEKEIVFTKLCKKIDSTESNEGNSLLVNIGQALSTKHHFGYMTLKPTQTKRAINLKYDMIYFIVEGTCVICTDYEKVIKGPKEVLSIKQGTPYQIENCGSESLMMIFVCFP